MKILIPVVCSLLLIGCGGSSSTETAPAAAETQSAATPAAAENGSAQPSSQTLPPVSESATAPTETAAPSAPSVDGGTLYSQKCTSCHGAKAEKPALGKSQVIASFNEQQIKDALKGYQAGTYGKEMKGLMQGQVKGLNDAQIDALAKHIAAF